MQLLQGENPMLLALPADVPHPAADRVPAPAAQQDFTGPPGLLPPPDVIAGDNFVELATIKPPLLL